MTDSSIIQSLSSYTHIYTFIDSSRVQIEIPVASTLDAGICELTKWYKEKTNNLKSTTSNSTFESVKWFGGSSNVI